MISIQFQLRNYVPIKGLCMILSENLVMNAGEIKGNLFLLHINVLLSMKTMVNLSIQVLRSVCWKKLNKIIFSI